MFQESNHYNSSSVARYEKQMEAFVSKFETTMPGCHQEILSRLSSLEEISSRLSSLEEILSRILAHQQQAPQQRGQRKPSLAQGQPRYHPIIPSSIYTPRMCAFPSHLKVGEGKDRLTLQIARAIDLAQAQLHFSKADRIVSPISPAVSQENQHPGQINNHGDVPRTAQ
ncbi:hypothetical protein NUU61_001608 [Penicillium alfredii]|uniref:Uncharacterized protein n=1 Tax=Penicillium alfredii TaxID=1506179 RepID=A0A9W9G1F2_9EURO|nr:uncharacterized protein NUU61_001608 [Penicillium alfredii]KAJ5110351.1 hypothetical protein NUU61_001608 [Penicillium alfredii]